MRKAPPKLRFILIIGVCDGGQGEGNLNLARVCGRRETSDTFNSASPS